MITAPARALPLEGYRKIARVGLILACKCWRKVARAGKTDPRSLWRPGGFPFRAGYAVMNWRFRCGLLALAGRQTWSYFRPKISTTMLYNAMAMNKTPTIRLPLKPSLSCGGVAVYRPRLCPKRAPIVPKASIDTHTNTFYLFLLLPTKTQDRSADSAPDR